jgi:GTPase
MVDVSEMAEGDPVHDFEVIREEVECYHPEMGRKPFVVAGTKIDIAGEGHKTKAINSFCKTKGIPFFEISSANTSGTKELILFLGQAVEKNRTIGAIGDYNG